jgi:hypothetical protein
MSVRNTDDLNDFAPAITPPVSRSEQYAWAASQTPRTEGDLLKNSIERRKSFMRNVFFIVALAATSLLGHLSQRV